MVDKKKIQEATKLLIEGIGEDTKRLERTWEDRVPSAYEELLEGYNKTPEEVLNRSFEVESNDIVMVKDIKFFSFCEHHLLPFYGKAHIAYIPNGKVTGLDKLVKLVNVFARRLQLQERMSQQIADGLWKNKELKVAGVMVVIEAEHMCMTMRETRTPYSKTVSSVVRGVFVENSKARAEVLELIK